MDEIILLRVTISGWRCTSTSEANRRRGAVGSQLDPRPPHAWSADKLQLRNCRGLKWSRQVLSHKDSRGIKVSRFSNWFGTAVVATFKGVIQSPDWGFFYSSFHCNPLQPARFDALTIYSLISIHWLIGAPMHHHVSLCSVHWEKKIDSVPLTCVLVSSSCARNQQRAWHPPKAKKPETTNVTS